MWLTAEVEDNPIEVDWRHGVREEFRFRGRQYEAEEINRVLEPMISADRLARIEEVLKERTETTVAVLEEIHDAANFKAVMRSSESLGFHWLHLIRREGRFVKNATRASSGSEKWMQTTAWESTRPCLNWLIERGYRIVAMSPDPDGIHLDEVDFSLPTALVFGNERDGISDEARSSADLVCRLPGVGFTSNFNLSVSVAISFYRAFQQRVQLLGQNGDLREDARNLLRAHYRFRSVRNPHAIIERLLGDDSSGDID